MRPAIALLIILTLRLAAASTDAQAGRARAYDLSSSLHRAHFRERLEIDRAAPLADLPALAREAEQHFVAESSEPHVARIYASGPVALEAKLQAIESARESIALEMFSIDEGAAGRSLLVALAEAKRRHPGLEARVLLDSLANVLKLELGDGTLAWLEASGVEVKLYNRGHNPLLASHRNHKKLLIIDRKRVFGGGRNIKDNYYHLRSKRAHQFMDITLDLEGPVAEGAARTFDAIWHNTDWASEVAADARPIPLELPAQARERLREATAGDLERTPAFLVRSAVFVSDFPGKRAEHRWVLPVFRRALEAARERILIENPYFLPTPEIDEILARKAGRDGIPVRVITNGYASSRDTQAMMPYLAAPEKQRLLRAGVRIDELTGESPLPRPLLDLGVPGIAAPPEPSVWGTHAKVAAIDGRWSWISSHNLDPRSADINLETGFLLDSPELTAHLESFLLGQRDRIARPVAAREDAEAHLPADPLERKLALEEINRNPVDEAVRRITNAFPLLKKFIKSVY